MSSVQIGDRVIASPLPGCKGSVYEGVLIENGVRKFRITDDRDEPGFFQFDHSTYKMEPIQTKLGPPEETLVELAKRAPPPPPCPKCGPTNVYHGFMETECATTGCDNYSARQADAGGGWR
jgi:hypothetical protein